MERDDYQLQTITWLAAALEDSSRMCFTSSAFRSRKGDTFKEFEILIHEELAKKSGLSLHDKIGWMLDRSESERTNVSLRLSASFLVKKTKRNSQACLLTSMKIKSLPHRK